MKKHPLAPTPQPSTELDRALGDVAPSARETPARETPARETPAQETPTREGARRTSLAERSGELNRRRLALRFAVRLMEERPQSVLDVGSGGGVLLAACRKARIPAIGTEVGLADVRALRSAGFRALPARAEELPFRHRSVDWLTYRHVAHHVADLDRALAEAVRVCRSGILIAEPWFDPSIPSQALGERLQSWRHRQHRRAGRTHRDGHTAGDLLARLPQPETFDVQVETVLSPGRVPLDEIEPILAREVRGLENGDPDRDELVEIRHALRECGATWNGSMILVVRRVRG